MSLWGCQLNSAFLNCADHFYTDQERLLLGGMLMALIALSAFLVFRRTRQS
jgi:hypothetical protein